MIKGMIIMLQVTYFHHSGFMVETEKHCFLFYCKNIMYTKNIV